MRKERYKWFGLLVIAASLLGILIFTNVFFDPANLFHDVSRPVAEALLDGEGAYVTSGNANERLIKKYMIEQMPKQVECLVLGSSTVIGIRRENVGTESFFNLGVSSADYYDIMTSLALLELNDVKAERIILGVDHYFFSEDLYENNARSKAWKPYAEYMEGIFDGETPAVPEADLKAERIEQFRQLFSVTYFQASIDYVNQNGSLNINRWGTVDEAYTGAYFAMDGSMVYPLEYEYTPIEEALRAARDYDLDYQFGTHRTMSERSRENFEKMLVYLLEQGIEVQLFLCPMSPALWERYDEERYPILAEVEAYVLEMAQKYDLEVIGSYNPTLLEIPNEAFYDARHIRHGLLSEYFDFAK